MNQSTKTPRVLHIVYNLIRGGTEGQCARVVLGLAERGWEQRVAVSRREGFFLEDVEKACGPVYEIGIRRMLSCHTLREIQRLERFQRVERFELVHAWDADAEIFGSIAARRAGIPYITSRRDLGEIYPFWKCRLMHRADRKARAVVVNAEAIGDRIVEEGIERSRIMRIPNIIDLAEFDRLAEKQLDLDFPPGPIITSVARLDPEKDISTMLKAMQMLLSQSPNLPISQSPILLLAGSGPEHPALEAMARELGLSKHVRFLGEFHDVPALLKRSDICVLTPSANEGLSNSILEYMAAGKPVVATDCGGNRELVAEGENGFVIPVGDTDALADRLTRLWHDRTLCNRMGEVGRIRIEQEFSRGKVLDQFAALYQGVAAACCER